jgi:hypothetical protein
MTHVKRINGRKRHRASATSRSSDQAMKPNRRPTEDDRRLDAELADTFPASDPPSILRRGPDVVRR